MAPAEQADHVQSTTGLVEQRSDVHDGNDARLSTADVAEINRFARGKSSIEEYIQTIEGNPPLEPLAPPGISSAWDHARVVEVASQNAQNVAQLRSWTEQLDALERLATDFQARDMSRLRDLSKAATRRHMSREDTELVGIALETLVVLDKLLALLGKRKQELDIYSRRLQWEQCRLAGWDAYFQLQDSTAEFVEQRGRWHVSIYEVEQTCEKDLELLTEGGSSVDARSETLSGRNRSRLRGRASRYALRERLELEASRIRKRAERINVEHVDQAGLALDQLIELTKVPERFLDEQEALEDRVALLRPQVEFVEALLRQWCRADDLHHALHALRDDARALCEEMEAIKSKPDFAPDREAVRGFTSREQHNLERLASALQCEPKAILDATEDALAPSRIGRRLIKHPQHHRWPDQRDFDARVEVGLSSVGSEAASVVKRACRAAADHRESLADYERLCGICSDACALAAELESIRKVATHGWTRGEAEGLAPGQDLSTLPWHRPEAFSARCLSDDNSSVKSFIDALPQLDAWLRRCEESASHVERQLPLASLACQKDGIPVASFQPRAREAMSRVDTARHAASDALRNLHADVDALTTARSAQDRVRTLQADHDNLREELLQEILRQKWSPDTRRDGGTERIAQCSQRLEALLTHARDAAALVSRLLQEHGTHLSSGGVDQDSVSAYLSAEVERIHSQCQDLSPLRSWLEALAKQGHEAHAALDAGRNAQARTDALLKEIVAITSDSGKPDTLQGFADALESRRATLARLSATQARLLPVINQALHTSLPCVPMVGVPTGDITLPAGTDPTVLVTPDERLKKAVNEASAVLASARDELAAAVEALRANVGQRTEQLQGLLIVVRGLQDIRASLEESTVMLCRTIKGVEDELDAVKADEEEANAHDVDALTATAERYGRISEKLDELRRVGLHEVAALQLQTEQRAGEAGSHPLLANGLVTPDAAWTDFSMVQEAQRRITQLETTTSERLKEADALRRRRVEESRAAEQQRLKDEQEAESQRRDAMAKRNAEQDLVDASTVSVKHQVDLEDTPSHSSDGVRMVRGVAKASDRKAQVDVFGPVSGPDEEAAPVPAQSRQASLHARLLRLYEELEGGIVEEQTATDGLAQMRVFLDLPSRRESDEVQASWLRTKAQATALLDDQDRPQPDDGVLTKDDVEKLRKALSKRSAKVRRFVQLATCNELSDRYEARLSDLLDTVDNLGGKTRGDDGAHPDGQGDHAEESIEHELDLDSLAKLSQALRAASEAANSAADPVAQDARVRERIHQLNRSRQDIDAVAREILDPGHTRRPHGDDGMQSQGDETTAATSPAPSPAASPASILSSLPSSEDEGFEDGGLLDKAEAPAEDADPSTPRIPGAARATNRLGVEANLLAFPTSNTVAGRERHISMTSDSAGRTLDLNTPRAQRSRLPSLKKSPVTPRLGPWPSSDQDAPPATPTSLLLSSTAKRVPTSLRTPSGSRLPVRSSSQLSNRSVSSASRSASRGEKEAHKRPNRYRANPKSKLDVAVGRIVNHLPVPVSIVHAAAGDGSGSSGWQDESGRYWVGHPEPKLCFCRILRSRTVMVRVGGGWQELSRYVLRHYSDLASQMAVGTGTPQQTPPREVDPAKLPWMSSATLAQSRAGIFKEPSPEIVLQPARSPSPAVARTSAAASYQRRRSMTPTNLPQSLEAIAGGGTPPSKIANARRRVESLRSPRSARSGSSESESQIAASARAASMSVSPGGPPGLGHQARRRKGSTPSVLERTQDAPPLPNFLTPVRYHKLGEAAAAAAAMGTPSRISSGTGKQTILTPSASQGDSMVPVFFRRDMTHMSRPSGGSDAPDAA